MEPVIKNSKGGSVFTYHYVSETAATGSELSSVAVKVFTPGGSELIATASVTPDADGKMSVSIPAAQAANSYEYCRAHFEYTYDSSDYTQDIYFHIAKTDFDIPYHYADLVKLQPDIGDYAFTGDAKFSSHKDSAIAEIYGRLLNGGRRPWLIINRSSLNMCLARMWLAHIYESLSNLPTDNWNEKAQFERAQFEDEFSRLNIIESGDDSANISGQESERIGSGRLIRG
jgi:hypothetical protein